MNRQLSHSKSSGTAHQALPLGTSQMPNLPPSMALGTAGIPQKRPLQRTATTSTTQGRRPSAQSASFKNGASENVFRNATNTATAAAPAKQQLAYQIFAESPVLQKESYKALAAVGVKQGMSVGSSYENADPSQSAPKDFISAAPKSSRRKQKVGGGKTPTSFSSAGRLGTPVTHNIQKPNFRATISSPRGEAARYKGSPIGGKPPQAANASTTPGNLGRPLAKKTPAAPSKGNHSQRNISKSATAHLKVPPGMPQVSCVDADSSSNLLAMARDSTHQNSSSYEDSSSLPQVSALNTASSPHNSSGLGATFGTVATPMTQYEKSKQQARGQGDQSLTSRMPQRQGTGDSLDVSEEVKLTHHQVQVLAMQEANTNIQSTTYKREKALFEPTKGVGLDAASTLRRKQPALRQVVVEPDEGPPPMVQLPAKQRSEATAQTSQQQMMFAHPYGSRDSSNQDHFSEESTQMYTMRNRAGQQLSSTARGGHSTRSATTEQGRVNRDKIGQGQPKKGQSMVLTTAAAGSQQAQQQQMSLTQSFFSALGNLVGAGNVNQTTNTPSGASSARGPQGSRQSSQNFTSQAEPYAGKRQGKESYGVAQGSARQDGSRSLIKIQETTEPMQTEHLGGDSFLAQKQGLFTSDSNLLVGAATTPRIDPSMKTSGGGANWLQTESQTAKKRHSSSESSMRLNSLQKMTRNTFFGCGFGGRNEVMKTEAHLGAFSSLGLTRSPMKSRQFTKPPQQPQQDEIVESMNIVTIDMVALDDPIAVSKQAKAMRIQESGRETHPSLAAAACENSSTLEHQQQVAQQRARVSQAQQQQRSLTQGQQTYCSCSACDQSQTAYEAGHQMAASSPFQQQQQSTRICLETTEIENVLIKAIVSMVKPQRTPNNLQITSQKRILLERIQNNCEHWYESCSQFYNLHAVFEKNGNAEGQTISNLIKKTQAVLCVAVGLIAAIALDVQASCDLENITIADPFSMPCLVLQDAYLIQMKLTSIILRKMERAERRSNEFAIKLQERITAFKQENPPLGALLPEPSVALDEEGEECGGDVSTESEDSGRLETFLTGLIDNQIRILSDYYDYRTVGVAPFRRTLTRNLVELARSDVDDLEEVKHWVSTEVNTFQTKLYSQEHNNHQHAYYNAGVSQTRQQNTVRSQDDQQPFQRATLMQDDEDQLVCHETLPPQHLGPTTQQAEPSIEEHLLAKQRILTQGQHLSEIGEEPIQVLSTEQNGAPSVERDISRISSNTSTAFVLNQQPPTITGTARESVQSANALGAPQYNQFQQSESQEGGAEESSDLIKPMVEDNTVSQEVVVGAERMVDQEIPEVEGPLESNILPASTKKYTLVLDLDETLIHSVVQYPKWIRTRAQLLDYIEELAVEFREKEGREPTKEERENLPIEMAFNFRPYVVEFLEAMASEYELVIFTAGEQDYADEIIDKLDEKRYITHRLYRQHTCQVKDANTGATKHYVKDIGKTGRPLERMIIIDNIKENYCRQPRNGIQITTWKDDPLDTELIILQRLLLSMAKQEAADVRVNLDRLKLHGLLPSNETEVNSCAFDESSSFQGFEPVAVIEEDLDGEEEKSNDQLSSALKQKVQISPGKDLSIDSYRSGSQHHSQHYSQQSQSAVKQKSISKHSFYQKTAERKSSASQHSEKSSLEVPLNIDDEPVRVMLQVADSQEQQSCETLRKNPAFVETAQTRTPQLEQQ